MPGRKNGPEHVRQRHGPFLLVDVSMFAGGAGGSLRSDAPSVQSHPWPHRCGGLNTRVTAVTEGFRSRVYEHRERSFAAKRCGIPASMVSMHVRTANPADV